MEDFFKQIWYKDLWLIDNIAYEIYDANTINGITYYHFRTENKMISKSFDEVLKNELLSRKIIFQNLKSFDCKIIIKFHIINSYGDYVARREDIGLNVIIKNAGEQFKTEEDIFKIIDKELLYLWEVFVDCDASNFNEEQLKIRERLTYLFIKK